jgi:hypothetical protein
MHTKGGVGAGRGPGYRRRTRWRATPLAGVAVLLCLLLAPTAVAPPHARAAVVTAVLERTVLLSNLSPPSPDPSGIAWDPGASRFLITDSEVEEMAIFQDANLFELNLQGALTGTGDFTGTGAGTLNEPTGASFDPASGHLFLTDDIKRKVFRFARGADGDFGTPDDTLVSSFDTAAFGNLDPEDVAYDTDSGHLFMADGAGREIFRVSPGGNGQFDGVPPGGDDVFVNQFDTAQYGSTGSEGLAYDPARNTLLILDPSTKRIFETTRAGLLLNTIDLSVANPRHAEDVVLAPSLAHPGQMSMYVVARGQDNNANPDENDGKMQELSVSLPSMGNQTPVADAGPNKTVTMPNSATLAGSVSDDGLPAGATLTSTWSQLPGGPGTATFTNPTSPTTDVTFSAPGTYVLRLTADDTELQGHDDVSVTVNAANTVVLDIPIVASSDDAEEAASGKVNRVNGDLELALDATAQTVGLRFQGVSIPQGATILASYVQFQADEKSSTAVTLTIEGQAADSAGAFTVANFGISSRPRTGADATWAPEPWTAIGERGPKQRTSDLSSVLQEIVDRPGWSGTSMVLIVRGNGVGRRTAESFNAGPSLAPTLHVEYSTS